MPESSFAANRVMPDRGMCDWILVAFHLACDEQDFAVAEQLLRSVETLLARKAFAEAIDRRKHFQRLVAAHERLWQLRHDLGVGNWQPPS